MVEVDRGRRAFALVFILSVIIAFDREAFQSTGFQFQSVGESDAVVGSNFNESPLSHAKNCLMTLFSSLTCDLLGWHPATVGMADSTEAKTTAPAMTNCNACLSISLYVLLERVISCAVCILSIPWTDWPSECYLHGCVFMLPIIIDRSRFLSCSFVKEGGATLYSENI